MWGWETAQDVLRTAGFRDIQRHVLPHDPMMVRVTQVSRTSAHT
jgi:hemerythrin